jgi:hypothetical protein
MKVYDAASLQRRTGRPFRFRQDLIVSALFSAGAVNR